MTSLEQFLVKNLPLTYQATFTIVCRKGRASIVGGLAVYNACNQVVAQVENLDCDHRTLEALALRFNSEQPPVETLEEKIAQALEDMAVRSQVIFS